MALPPGVIQLNGGDGGGHPPPPNGHPGNAPGFQGRVNQGPPPPPPMGQMPHGPNQHQGMPPMPHHRPGQHGGPLPQNPMVQQQQQQQQQLQQRLGQGQFPHQSRGPPVSPLSLTEPRRKVEIFDIHSECLTENDARERLSSFAVIYMARADPSTIQAGDTHHHHHLYHPEPTWDRAVHSEQTDIQKHDAQHKVWELDQTTRPVADKRQDLPPALQRQFDHAQEKLEMRETDPRYQWGLAQFYSKMKKVDRSPIPAHKYIEYHAKNDKGKYRSGKSADRKREKSKHKQRKYEARSFFLEPHRPVKSSKRKKERVSVTAYFKRTPRLDESALRMLREQEEAMGGVEPGIQRQQFPIHGQNQQHPVGPGQHPQGFPPQGQQHFLGQHGPGFAPQGQIAGPPHMAGPHGHQMPPHGHGFPPQQGQHNMQHPQQRPVIPPPPPQQQKPKPGKEGKSHVEISGKKPKVYPASPRSSLNSLSDDDGWSDSDSGFSTPPSSNDSDYRGRPTGRGRRSPSRSRSRPEHFGGNRRHHSKTRRLPPKIVRPVTPPPPPRRGLRLEQPTPFNPRRNQTWEDDFEQSPPGLSRRNSMTPRILQGIRRFPSEALRDRYDDDLSYLEDRFDTMRLGEDSRLGRGRSYADDDIIDRMRVEDSLRAAREREYAAKDDLFDSGPRRRNRLDDFYEDDWQRPAPRRWDSDRVDDFVRNRDDRIHLGPGRPLGGIGRQQATYRNGLY